MLKVASSAGISPSYPIGAKSEVASFFALKRLALFLKYPIRTEASVRREAMAKVSLGDFGTFATKKYESVMSVLCKIYLRQCGRSRMRDRIADGSAFLSESSFLKENSNSVRLIVNTISLSFFTVMSTISYSTVKKSKNRIPSKNSDIIFI